jgi:hypothetical protein
MGGGDSIAPRILNLGTGWRWMVRCTPRPICPLGKRPGYALDRLGGSQSRSGRGGEEKNSITAPSRKWCEPQPSSWYRDRNVAVINDGQICWRWTGVWSGYKTVAVRLPYLSRWQITMGERVCIVPWDLSCNQRCVTRSHETLKRRGNLNSCTCLPDE